MIDAGGAGMTMTLNAWDALPSTEENRHWECVRGEIVVAPEPLIRHGRAMARLFSMLERALPTELLVALETSAVLVEEPLTIRNPDVAVLRPSGDANRHWHTPEHFLLVVEVLSPSSIGTDRRVKLAEYAVAGIPEYWIVDPVAPSLTCFRLDAEGDYELVGEHTGVAHVPTCGTTVTVDVPALGR
jgi:Uma2 family endonuclease